MRQRGLAGVTRRKRRNLTKPDPAAAAVPDLLRREFTAPMLGVKLIGDISCFPASEGWLYLATVLDLCSKELVGYTLAPHMRADRGSPYHATAYRNALRRLETRQSMSRIGSCFDGAAAESFFAMIKSEIGVTFWPDRVSARRDIENWIKTYNERRLHSTIGYRTPTEMRRAWQELISTTV